MKVLQRSDGGRFNSFQNGSIYWHPMTGAWDLSKSATEAYVKAGAEKSFLSYPVGGNDGPNIFFQRGFITGGAPSIIVPFTAKWESGPIPTSAPISASVTLQINGDGAWSYEGHF